MSDTKVTVPAPAIDALLGLLERDSRILHGYIVNPPAQFSPEDVRKHIAKLYSYSEALVDLAEKARSSAEQSNGAEQPVAS